MRKAHLIRGLFVAAAAVCALALSAVPPAQAGNKKPGFVRVPSAQGFARGGPFLGQPPLRVPSNAQRLHKRGGRPGFVKRRDERRRHRPIVPTGYYYAPSYVYDYQPGAASAPSYPSEASEPAPAYRPPPVTPKWVHVGDDLSAPGAAGDTFAGDRLGRNCLSVKTQITVDGKPVDAFGEACLLADGSWQLQPSEQSD